MLSINLIVTCFVVAPQEHISELQNSPPPPPYQTISLSDSLLSFNVEYLKLIQGVRYSFPVNDYLFGHIEKIPELAENISNTITKSHRNIPELFHLTNSLISSKAGGYGPPITSSWRGKTIETESDVNSFFELEGVDLQHSEEWNKLPFSFRKGILEFLVYIDRAKSIIDQYNQPVVKFLNFNENDNINDIQNKLMTPWTYPELKNWEIIHVLDLADKKKLSYASRIASEKLSLFFKQTGTSIPNDFKSCSITSCLGECLINGTGNDTIKGNKFCVVEIGGDDVYIGNTASPTSIRQPVGIVIDLDGNDKYLCEENYLAAGVLGLAILLDLQGDDYYITNKPGLSCSIFGSSMLYDSSGDDVYISSNTFSQASAFVGTSLFIDISGDDIYTCQSYSQGYGGTLGVGLFYDHLGDDHYNSDNTGSNNYSQSFIQGTAKGRWAEATDGQSLTGGIGIFIDNSGTDEYAAGNFSQGASYYFGLGLFVDNKGNDNYNAVSHSQGYAAHYSLAAFMENDGNDMYNKKSDAKKLTQIIGGGRDNSAGLFLDYKGDDTYHFGNRSAGIGDLNGIGLLIDYSGNDNYLWHKNAINSNSPSLGKTIEKGSEIGLSFKIIPQKNMSKGLFFDSNGDNISD